MKAQKLNSDVFRRAAELVAEAKCCGCVALSDACRAFGERSNHYAEFFQAMLKPVDRPYFWYWWSPYEDDGLSFNENPRVIALLLCAEMIEGGAR